MEALSITRKHRSTQTHTHVLHTGSIRGGARAERCRGQQVPGGGGLRPVFRERDRLLLPGVNFPGGDVRALQSEGRASKIIVVAQVFVFFFVDSKTKHIQSERGNSSVALL